MRRVQLYLTIGLFVLAGFCSIATAQYGPSPIPGEAPIQTSIVARVGTDLWVPVSTIEDVHTAPNGVVFCDLVYDPNPPYKPKYGSISWTFGDPYVHYRLESNWWAKALWCDGFHPTTDSVWYKVANGPNNCDVGDEAFRSNYWFDIGFEPDTASITPIATPYPYINENVQPAEICYPLCFDTLSNCIPLSTIFRLNYENMEAMFDNEPAIPNVDLWIKKQGYSPRDGACWPVIGKNGQQGDMIACYYADDDCIIFKAVEGRNMAQISSNSPYQFTYCVTNRAGGEACATVTVQIPCSCCDKTYKKIWREVDEGGQIYIPFTELYYKPCPDMPNTTNVYSLITESGVILSTPWADTVNGGWVNYGPMPVGVITSSLQKAGVDYTAPGPNFVQCCDTRNDFFYIRTVCYTNVGGQWIPIPGAEDQTQVKIIVRDVYITNGLSATTNYLTLNRWQPGSTDPCGPAQPDQWEEICRGECRIIPICTLFKYIDTKNCTNDLYIDSLTSLGGIKNRSELGGSLYISPGDQVGGYVTYCAPTGVVGTVTDYFNYVVGDMGDPNPDRIAVAKTVQKVRIVISDCEVCEPEITPVVVDVCAEGDTNVLTAAFLTSEQFIKTCVTGELCLAAIYPAPEEAYTNLPCEEPRGGDVLYGTYRVNYTTNCFSEDCEGCLKELLYIGLESAQVGVGIDKFWYVVQVKDANGSVIATYHNEITFIVRPVTDNELVAVDVEGEDVMQDRREQVVLNVEDLYAQLKGYGNLHVKLSFDKISEEGGLVDIECQEVETEIEDPTVDFIGCCDDLPWWWDWDCGCEEDPVTVESNFCGLVYTPPRGFVGTDIIHYTITDGTLSECGGELNEASGTVTVEVIADLRAPVANPDEYTMRQGTILRVAMPGVMRNDWYPLPTGQQILPNVIGMVSLLVDEPENGRVNFGHFGEFGYQPDAGFIGEDSFTYQVYAPEFLVDFDEAQSISYWLSFDWYTGLWSQPGTVTIKVTPEGGYVQHDYLNLGKANVSIMDDTFVWYIRQGSSGGFAYQWGYGDCIPVPGDYDGDGIGVMALDEPIGGFWVGLSSEVGWCGRPRQWGYPGVIPVPADYDGDGETEMAVYDPNTGNWFVRGWSPDTDGERVFPVQWGYPNGIPVPADYDGDGKCDKAVVGPFEMGVPDWWILKTDPTIVGGSLSSKVFVRHETWGFPGSVPLAADLDGDKKADPIIYGDLTGTGTSAKWYKLGDATGVSFGPSGASILPVPADYLGDGKADLAVYDLATGMWYIQDGADTEEIQWGFEGTVPVSSAAWVQQ